MKQIHYNEIGRDNLVEGKKFQEQAEESERPTCSHNQELHKNTKLIAKMPAAGSVLASSVSVSPFEPCLIGSEGSVLLMFSIPSVSYILFFSFLDIPEL